MGKQETICQCSTNKQKCKREFDKIEAIKYLNENHHICDA